LHAVPRWADVELPSQAHDVDAVQNNKIGYVLDEWYVLLP